LTAAHGLATLATLRPDGHPFARVVQYVHDDQGQPITLISEMAEHTKNIRIDARASIIVASTVQPGDDPMSLPRVTVLGDLRPLPAAQSDATQSAFVGAHPPRRPMSGSPTSAGGGWRSRPFATSADTDACRGCRSPTASTPTLIRWHPTPTASWPT
jgi:hypothetical protein